MASKSLKKVRSMQTLSQNRLMTLLDKQSTIIHDQDKIIERIDEFYSELYDSEQSTIFHTDPKKVPSWEVEAALRDMKNGTATSNDLINIKSLTAGGDTISMTVTKCSLNAFQKDEYPQRGRTLR